MEDQGLDLIKSLPGLLDFPLTIFVVWTGLRIWREAKELVVRIDDRHQKTLRDIADKTDRALARVTEGMGLIREEVRVFRAEVFARRGGGTPGTRTDTPRRVPGAESPGTENRAPAV